jgi:hypothetical protein
MVVLFFFDSVVADWPERTAVGGAITFTVIGMVLGTSGFGAINLSLNTDALGSPAGLTLAMLLFVDAATAGLIAVACTVLMSILGHGLSAKPLTRFLLGRLAAEDAPTASKKLMTASETLTS